MTVSTERRVLSLIIGVIISQFFYEVSAVINSDNVVMNTLRSLVRLPRQIVGKVTMKCPGKPAVTRKLSSSSNSSVKVKLGC